MGPQHFGLMGGAEQIGSSSRLSRNNFLPTDIHRSCRISSRHRKGNVVRGSYGERLLDTFLHSGNTQQALESAKIQRALERVNTQEALENFSKLQQALESQQALERSNTQQALESVDTQQAVESVVDAQQALESQQAVESVDTQQALESVDTQQALESVDTQQAVESFSKLQQALESGNAQQALESFSKLQQALESGNTQQALESISKLQQALESVESQQALESVDIQQALESVDTQQALESVNSKEFWDVLNQPNFDSGAAAQLLDRVAAQFRNMRASELPRFEAPQLTQLQGIQLPPMPELPEPRLPELPRLESLQGVNLSQLATSLHAPQLPQFTASSLSDAVASTSEAIGSFLESPLQRSTEASASLEAAVASLGSAIAGSITAVVGTSTELQPHYGTRAAQQALERLSQQLAEQLGCGGGGGGNGEGCGPQDLLASQLASLQGTVAELRSSVNPGPSCCFLPSKMVMGEVPDWQMWSYASAQPHVALGPLPSLTALLASGEAALASAQLYGVGGYSLGVLALIAAGLLALVAASVPPKDYDPMDRVLPDTPLPLEYSAPEVAAYWGHRPVAVAIRAAEVAAAAAQFGSGLLLDMMAGRLHSNSFVRAAQLRGIIERLGPAYIKVAQAVSTRVDILEPAYLLEIERLQDRVPPFETELARARVAEALGRPVEQAFAAFSAEPVAAASLGQVYRGRLSPALGGGEVAVKVQRPGVAEGVALDLLLMRRLAEYAQTWPQVRTDWVGLIDEWAVRFFHELDYEREGRNSVRFAADMAQLEGIVVPRVFGELSTRQVLITEWMEGEKLSASTASDVRELCNTLLSAYLIQLLDTGFLHADPHPGNLIRTADGKICILDFGLMTEVSPEQSIALVEYIAHLSVEDWEGVARDLSKLGFMPPGAPDTVVAGLVAPLGSILEQLTRGGGARGFNIDKLTAELNALSASYPFQIPPYFALILRCFSVIEGIALRVDPDYAIVAECFPYLSRRLLTDNQPRMRAALRQLLFGDKARLDTRRLRRLADGFSNFTVEGLQQQPAAAPAVAAAPSARPQLSPMQKEALAVVFSAEGSYLQEVLVDEAVAAIDALSREALSELFRRLLGSAPALVAMTTVAALGPLRPVVLPLPTPLELLSRLAPAVAPTPEDEEALDTLRGLLEIAQMQLLGPDVNLAASSLALLAELWPLLPQLTPGLAKTGELLVQAMVRRVSQRAADLLRPASEQAVVPVNGQVVL